MFIKEEEPQEHEQPGLQGDGVVELFPHNNYSFESKRCQHCISNLPLQGYITRPFTSGC